MITNARLRRVARAVVGGFLAIRFATWLPHAEDLFGPEGTVSSAGLNPFPIPALTPMLDAVFAAPSLIVGALLVLSLVHASGRLPRASALLLFVGMALCFHRNQLILNPSMPFLAWWMLSHAVMPREDGADREPFWRRYRDVTWWITGLAYTYSGVTKLMSPSWQRGQAGALIMGSPLGRDHLLVQTLERWPQLLTAGTYAMLWVELAMLPLALCRRTRPYALVALIGLHLSLLATVNIADITVGMLVFHVTQLEAGWFGRSRANDAGVHTAARNRSAPRLPLRDQWWSRRGKRSTEGTQSG